VSKQIKVVLQDNKVAGLLNGFGIHKIQEHLKLNKGLFYEPNRTPKHCYYTCEGVCYLTPLIYTLFMPA
jgi:hypothetical protein